MHLSSWSTDDLIYLAIELVCLLVAVMVHEVAHGYVAYRLGDPTAKRAGRLTMNPAKHLDPMGSVVLPLLMLACNGPVFAYAKPVPYNPAYFKHRKRDELFVAFAGPLSNLLQALLGAAVAWAVHDSWSAASSTGMLEALYWTYQFAALYCYINLILLFFNIIPLPPLDGATIVTLFLNERGVRTFYKIKQYSMMILLALLVLVPMVLGWSPLSWYFKHTAGALYSLLMP